MELIRTVIVDDEPAARRRLRVLLERRAGVAVLGEASNGVRAVELLRAERPDVVFLDIQMPDLDGFGVIEAMGPERMPVVVFVTAFESYAIDAFAVSALDYLLKPFEDERFDLAFDRALRHVQQRRSSALCERLACLVEGRRLHLGADLPAPVKPLRRLTVHRNGRIFFVPVGDVDWIEAAGSYVRVHAGARTHLLRDSIKRLEAHLDPQAFARIHRSAMVRIDRIEALRPLFHGEYEVQLTTGATLKLSRSYRATLAAILAG